MSEPVRQHPSAMVILGLLAIRKFAVSPNTREFLIPFAFFMWLGLRNLPVIIPVLVLLLILLAFVFYGVLKWYNFYFCVDEGTLQIHHGVWVKNKINIPRERIQAIDISRGVLQRLFGVVALSVQTAGESDSEAQISAILRDDADKLISSLGEDKVVTEADKAKAKKYHLSFPMLLLGGSISSNFLLIFTVGNVILSQVINRLGLDQVLDYFEGYSTVMTQHVVSLFLLLLAATWVVSLIHHVVRFHNFTLTVEKDRLIVNRGFFAKKQVTIPFQRIQAIRFDESWAKQLLGLCTLHVQSAGYGATLGQSTFLMPLMKNTETAKFLKDVIERYAVTVPAVKPPPRALIRYIIRGTFLFILLGAVIGYFTNFWIMVPFIAVGSMLGYWRYCDAGTGLYEKMAVMRYRFLARQTVIFPKHRIQSAIVSRNLMQRRRNLASLTFYVASAGGGTGYKVSDLSKDWSWFFYQWVAPNVQIDKEKLEESKSVYLPAFPGFQSHQSEQESANLQDGDQTDHNLPN